MSETILEFRDVSKMFYAAGTGAFSALRGVDLSIRQGEFVALLGPSGCGKSTLLNMAAGLMKPSAGEVVYRGAVVQGANTDVGYMTQKDSILPWRTAAGNVALPLEIQRVPRRERQERVTAMLARVGLSDAASRYPTELSGGMKKRVLLGRCLVYNPHTLLMDEPFGALDAQLRASLQQDLVHVWERERPTILFVTHDIEEAILLADRIVVFGTKPGRVIHEERLDLPRPRDMRSVREDPASLDAWTRLWGMLHSNDATTEGDSA
jgi:ABC-type nitrate/sulfonate/bicarbonate transport system, ATPase component